MADPRDRPYKDSLSLRNHRYKDLLNLTRSGSHHLDESGPP